MTCSAGIRLYITFVFLLSLSILLLIYASQTLQDHEHYVQNPDELDFTVPPHHVVLKWPVYIAIASGACSLAVVFLAFFYKGCGNSTERSCFQAHYHYLYFSFVALMLNSLLGSAAFLSTWIVHLQTPFQSPGTGLYNPTGIVYDFENWKCLQSGEGESGADDQGCLPPRQLRYLLIPYAVVAVATAGFGRLFLQAEERTGAPGASDRRLEMNRDDIEMDRPPRYEATNPVPLGASLGDLEAFEVGTKMENVAEPPAAVERTAGP